LFGLIAVIVACLAADKLTSFDSNMRNLAIGGFAGITLGAFIAFMQLNGSSQLNMTVKSGIGIWFTVIAGTIGLLSVTGIIKFDNIGQSFKNPNPPAPPHHPNYPPYPPQQPPYPPPPNYPQYPPPP